MELKYQFEYRISIARDFKAEGKFLHALQVYNSLLNDYPGYPEIYYGIAEIYEQFENIDPAISLMKAFLKGDPENKEMRLFLGQYLLRNERWDGAIEFLSFLLPEEEPVVSFFLGYSHFMLKDYELAKINFLNFISLEKQTELLHEAHIYLAKIEILLNNFESALSFAKKANVIYSNFWELNLIFAITYFNLGMFAHAVSPVEKAIKLNPQEASPYEWAGKIYFKLGDYAKAEKKYLKYIESIEDASSDIYTKLAEVYLKSSKAQDALNYFNVALKLDPENKFALEGKINAVNLLNNKVNDA